MVVFIGCNWLLNKIEVEDTRRGKLYVFNYNDFVPHGKTSAIGMRRIDVSSVQNIGDISTRSTEGKIYDIFQFPRKVFNFFTETSK